jgi:hypothetical protein
VSSMNLKAIGNYSGSKAESIPPPHPEILSHPNIPKPMHGVNPRTVMGKEAWDKFRPEVYRKYNFHCACCGVHKSQAKKHKWLEAHESYDIDYRRKVLSINSIEPLCNYCHSFIHSGLLSIKLLSKERSVEEVREVLTDGAKILKKYELVMNRGTAELCSQLGVKWEGKVSRPVRITWSGW